MELKVYQSIVRRHAKLAPGLRLEAYRGATRKLTGPLSVWERKISASLVARARSKPWSWYHGGLAGRALGDLILPPSKTGAASWKTTDAWSEQNRDRVYITHYAEGAEYFARWNERLGADGAVYVVEPRGPLSVDPEAFRLAMLLQEDPAMRERHLAHIGDLLSRFTCEAAKVVGVHERASAALCPVQPHFP